MFDISKAYLLPNGYIFKFLSYINENFKLVMFSIFVFITGYPVYHFGMEYVLRENLRLEAVKLAEDIKQKQAVYQTFLQHQTNSKEKEQYISQINQQLQKVFAYHQVKLEQMQWNLDLEKSIYFSLNHKVTTIFKLINDLSKTKHIKFKEIDLTKLNHEKQIQLKAIVIFMEDNHE
ncbi:chromosome segregation protein [Actinobacillus vicugnae]|uniref:chromosome segregation protein n=1 Tax=Actinobacillus vicugnae TaxID=2573093 RepID=UPI001242D46C|nr:chromosome segregation protein [Actinobacillus vicugnae]